MKIGEISISHNGEILLPNLLNVKDGSELVLYLKDECVVFITLDELKKRFDRITNDNRLNSIELSRLSRSIFPFCLSISGDFSNDSVIRIKLPKTVLLKYNFDKTLIYDVRDNKICLWSLAKYDEINSNLNIRNR